MSTPLPAYIDREAWEEYEAMRKRIKKPLTPRMIRQKLARLQEFKEAGYDVTSIIDEATNGYWLDFYQPKDKPIERKAGSQAEETKQWLDSQRQTPEQRRASEDARRIAMGGLKVVR